MDFFQADNFTQFSFQVWSNQNLNLVQVYMLSGYTHSFVNYFVILPIANDYRSQYLMY